MTTPTAAGDAPVDLADLGPLTQRDRATARRVALLEHLEHLDEQRLPMPSLRQLVRTFGLTSTRTVALDLAALEALGLVERFPGMARGLRVNRDAVARYRAGATP